MNKCGFVGQQQMSQVQIDLFRLIHTCWIQKCGTKSVPFSAVHLWSGHKDAAVRGKQRHRSSLQVLRVLSLKSLRWGRGLLLLLHHQDDQKRLPPLCEARSWFFLAFGRKIMTLPLHPSFAGSSINTCTSVKMTGLGRRGGGKRVTSPSSVPGLV